MLFQTCKTFIFGTQIKVFLMKSERNATDMFKAQKGSKDIVKIATCDISGSTVILWSYETTFCVRKENKNNDFIQQLLWSS